jgi:hypothetical protein
MASRHSLLVVPLICPECGHPLPAGDDDVIFFCASCASALEINGGVLVKREINHLAGDGDCHISFWVMPFQACTGDMKVESVEGFRSLSGSVTPPGASRLSGPPLIFVPSSPFSSPPLLVRAGRLLTLRQPALTASATRPGQVAPIVFTEEDAGKMAEIILLATVASDRKKNPRFMETFSCRLGKGKLCTIPFEETSGKLYHAGMNLEL